MTRPQPSESAIQRAFVQWCHLQSRRWPALNLAYSVPNGAVLGGDSRLRAIQMAKLKAEGLRVGCPDWVLPAPQQNGFHGYFVEFKKPGGKTSQAQLDYHSLLRMYGHRVEVYDNLEDAIAGTIEYLRGV